MKFNITTLGCPKNTVDSAHLEEALLGEGFDSEADPGEADIILVNTCGFIRDAKEESVDEILGLARLKGVPGSGSRVPPGDQQREGRAGDAGEEADGRKLLVFGCLAQRYREELLKEIPEIDGLWGVGSEDDIVGYCKRIRDGRQSSVCSRQSGVKTQELRVRSQGSGARTSYAYLKIAEGCNKRCTFCVIPSIRGPFRSAEPGGLLREAERHVRGGARELILVAQDITDYGRDLRGYGLVPLLRDLASIEGDFRIRLLYLYPTAVTDELLEFVASEKKVFDYLDIPLQHSEDRLLRLMGRRGTRREYLKLIRRVRRSIPGVTLRTTFIIGFPTETEDDFNGLVDFIEEIKFERLGAFMYSREEGTAAALLKGQVPAKVKQRRLDELMGRQAQISLEKNRELLGRRFEALVEEVEGKLAIARIGSQAPEIDGVTMIEQSAVGSQTTGVESPESRVQRHGSGGEGEESGAESRESRVKSQEASEECQQAGEEGRGIESGRHDARLDLRTLLAAGDVVTVEIVDAYDYDLKARLVTGDSAVPAARR